MLEELRKYSVIGIRGLADDEEYQIGDTCRKSYDWDYENDISTYSTTQIKLNGTCAADTRIDTTNDRDEEILEKINAIINDFGYVGEIVIIAGNDFEYGADENEIIIENAIVLDIRG